MPRTLACDAPTPTAFTLPCPKCKCADASVSVHLAFLDDDCFTCAECDGEFGCGDVRRTINAWERVLSWLAAAPTFGDIGPDGLAVTEAPAMEGKP